MSAEEARAILDEKVGDLGDAQHERIAEEAKRDAIINEMQKAHNAAVLAIRAKFEPRITAQIQREEKRREEIIEIADPWLDELAERGTAMIRTPNGEVKYNRGQEKVVIVGDQKKLVQRIRRLRLMRKLLRVKISYEIDKGAVKKHRNLLPQLPQIRIEQNPYWDILPGRTPGVSTTVPAAPRKSRDMPESSPKGKESRAD